MANITDFTEKQFEDRLEKNVERLTKNRLAVESPTAFLPLIMIRSNNSTQILTN